MQKQILEEKGRSDARFGFCPTIYGIHKHWSEREKGHYMRGYEHEQAAKVAASETDTDSGSDS